MVGRAKIESKRSRRPNRLLPPSERALHTGTRRNAKTEKKHVPRLFLLLLGLLILGLVHTPR